MDIDTKWLKVVAESPRWGGSWFLGVSVFRHRWEFGLDRDWCNDEYSRYYLYLQHSDKAGALITQYEFPRKNRWTHVTGI